MCIRDRPALYKGLSAGFLRQLTYGMSRLGIFRTLTNTLTPEGKTAADLSISQKFGCSVIAGGLGALIGTPADAALVRMQGDSTLPPEQRRNYKNGVDAMVCLLYTSDAADDLLCVDLGGRRIIKQNKIYEK
eukprot:TRINITY_DN27340_c0_g1_i1.p1 TRINITY_DN27340_c0_g1~~TRINITY_DN27340_c0_g1_i1.p1  ORF type:complete len:132 (+),score=59.38 TRINITY_DN27340_c0_g1_i1:93-488(+)